jgi:hypothetical protein
MARLAIQHLPATVGLGTGLLDLPGVPVLHGQVPDRDDRVRLLPAALLEERDVAGVLAEGVAEHRRAAQVEDVGLHHVESRAPRRQPVGDVLVDHPLVPEVGGVAQEPWEVAGFTGAGRPRQDLGGRRVAPRGVVEPEQAEIDIGALHGLADGRTAPCGQPLIGVEHQDPVPGGALDGEVSRGGEVVVPRPLEDPGPPGGRQLAGGVGGAGVDQHHLVHDPLHRVEAAGEHQLLVASDHAEGEPGHRPVPSNRSAAGGVARPARERPPAAVQVPAGADAAART